MLLSEVPLFVNNIGRDFANGARDGQKKKALPAAVEPVQGYLEGVAKCLVDRIYGSQGLPWGTEFAELEDVVLSEKQVLSEKMLAQALERQAQTAEQRPDLFQKCSDCDGPVAAKPAPEPRNVETRTGEAEWEEPHCYCRKCQLFFFPSEQEG